MELILFEILGVLLIITECGANYCQTFYSNNVNFYYMYCADGCCGYAYDRSCCTPSRAGEIAGGVIGCLAAIAIIVAIVIFCYIAQKNKKRKEEEEYTDPYEFDMMNPNHPNYNMRYGLTPPGEPEVYGGTGFPGAPLGPPPEYHPPPAPIQNGGARGGPNDLPPTTGHI